MNSLDGSGLERKAAMQVCEFEKLAFVYFALVGLTSVHKIQKIAPTCPLAFLEALNLLGVLKTFSLEK